MEKLDEGGRNGGGPRANCPSQSLANRTQMNPLLGSQCLHGFDGSGAACWDDRGCESEQEDGERGQHDYGWIERIDLKEQVAQQARGKDRSQDTDSATHESQLRARPQ